MSSIEFKRVLRNGSRVSFGDIRFVYMLNAGHRLGFTVSKKYGNSVNRNLLKRRCRHDYNKHFVGSLFDCSVVVSPISSGLNYKKVNRAFMQLVKYINDK